jgi:hypothetical protein
MAVLGFIIGGMLLLIFGAYFFQEVGETNHSSMGEGCVFVFMFLLVALVCLGLPLAFWLGGKM